MEFSRMAVKTRLMSILLGSMIFTWFIFLHIPKVVNSHFSDAGGEVTSAFLALAYSGIAFLALQEMFQNGN